MASLDIRSPEFWDLGAVDKELRRVYDICGGCRRCLPLCPSFKVLFDRRDVEAVDGSASTTVGRLGALAAPLSNWMNELAVHRAFMQAVVGIHRQRNLPKFARPTFSAWFAGRAASPSARRAPAGCAPSGRKVALFVTCSVEYYETSTGRHLGIQEGILRAVGEAREAALRRGDDGRAGGRDGLPAGGAPDRARHGPQAEAPGRGARRGLRVRGVKRGREG